MLNYEGRATTNTTCCNSGDEAAPRAQLEIVLTIISITVFGFCSLLVILSSFLAICSKMALTEVEEIDTTSQESKQERRRERKESILNELNVKEWMPDDTSVMSTEGDEDTSPSGDAVDAPQSAPALPINSSPASCAMGSNDCESLVGEEEMAGCAICLSHFEPQQLVCESNNSSCQHVFHKECMVDWLMKHHDTCPMCREVYLLKTV
jgi:hypothetical protein